MFHNLRAEMARHGLTVVSMASKLNLNDRTLGNKIAGKSEFTWSEVRRIRAYFFPSCSVEYLFEQDETCATSA